MKTRLIEDQAYWRPGLMKTRLNEDQAYWRPSLMKTRLNEDQAYWRTGLMKTRLNENQAYWKPGLLKTRLIEDQASRWLRSGSIWFWCNANVINANKFGKIHSTQTSHLLRCANSDQQFHGPWHFTFSTNYHVINSLDANLYNPLIDALWVNSVILSWNKKTS